jgi:lysyl endopeptidase
MRSKFVQRALIGLTATIGLSLTANAQVSYGGLPPSSFDPSLTGAVPTEIMPEVDVWRLLAEDEAAPKNQAMRFGQEIPVHLTLGNSGLWETLGNGDRVWRLRIESDDAYSISILFDDFEMPPGAELYAYNDGKKEVYGQFNSVSNKADRLFAIQPLAGDAMTLEYFEPAGTVAPGSLSIATVVHDYKDVVGLIEQQLEKVVGGPKAAGACNNDVNCPEGAPWGDQIRAVAAIFIGGGVCTGSMINNTSNDGTQYFITANHCGSMNNATFRFNYEKSGCGTGSAPTNMSVQGSTLMKAGSNGDYRLIRITGAIPSSYNVFMQGWDRSNVTPPNTVAIHHPQVGPKKISFDFNAPQKSGSDWRIVQWDDGVTEPGSSGSPLYSNQGLFIGALYGGAATCSFPFDDYYPRFGNTYSNMSQWLNPTGSGSQTLQGINLSGGPPPPSCGVTQIGLGAGGANVLTLDTSDSPVVGSTINLVATGFSGNPVATLILSTTNPSSSLLGGTVYVNTTNPFSTILVSTSLGFGTYALTLPSSPSLVGVTGYCQMAAPDSSQSFGWAFTNGLAVTFCP